MGDSDKVSDKEQPKQQAQELAKEQSAWLVGEAKSAQQLVVPDHSASNGSINIIPDIGMLIAKPNQNGIDFGKIVTISDDDKDRKVYEIKYDKDGAKEKLNESQIQNVLKLHKSINGVSSTSKKINLSPIAKLVVVILSTATTTILPINAAKTILLTYLIAIAMHSNDDDNDNDNKNDMCTRSNGILSNAQTAISVAGADLRAPNTISIYPSLNMWIMFILRAHRQKHESFSLQRVFCVAAQVK